MRTGRPGNRRRPTLAAAWTRLIFPVKHNVQTVSLGHLFEEAFGIPAHVQIFRLTGGIQLERRFAVIPASSKSLWLGGGSSGDSSESSGSALKAEPPEVALGITLDARAARVRSDCIFRQYLLLVGSAAQLRSRKYTPAPHRLSFHTVCRRHTARKEQVLPPEEPA